MAARTGASVGVAVTITILGILSLGLFVLTMVFYGRSQADQRDLRLANESMGDFVKPTEREAERVQTIRDRAKRQRESVVGYLLANSRGTMNAAAGNPDLTMEQLQERIGEVEGAGGSSLLGVIALRDREIQRLQGALKDADAARELALADARAEAERISGVEEGFRQQVDLLGRNVADYSDDVETYRVGVDDVIVRSRNDVANLETEFERRESDLHGTITELRRENQVLQDQLARLRGERPNDTISPLDEYALVDGQVDQVNAVDREVVIGIGWTSKVVLGMTFSIYSDSSQIRPNPDTGAYPDGKGIVEVINIARNFARCRILFEARGNPIVRGDVIANPVYDPEKTYHFVVYGNFDINRDGYWTPLERDDLAALIERWGGVVDDDITGNVDFLVLGQKPVIPPPPPAGAPIEVLNEFIRRQQEAKRYDELFDSAYNTSIPILNENRLHTLIGEIPN